MEPRRPRRDRTRFAVGRRARRGRRGSIFFQTRNEVAQQVPPHAQRLLKQHASVAPEQIVERNGDWNFLAEEKIVALSSKTFLQLGKRQRSAIAPREQFSVG